MGRPCGGKRAVWFGGPATVCVMRDLVVEWGLCGLADRPQYV